MKELDADTFREEVEAFKAKLEGRQLPPRTRPLLPESSSVQQLSSEVRAVMAADIQRFDEIPWHVLAARRDGWGRN